MPQSNLNDMVVEKLTADDMSRVSFVTKGTVTHSECNVDGTDDNDITQDE